MEFSETCSQLEPISLTILVFVEERIQVTGFNERRVPRQEASSAVASQVLQKRAGDEFHKLARPLHCTLLHYTALHCTLQCTEVRFYAPAAFSPHQRGLLGSENHIRGEEWTHTILKQPKIGNHHTYNIESKFDIGFSLGLFLIHCNAKSISRKQTACLFPQNRESLKSNTALANVDTVR